MAAMGKRIIVSGGDEVRVFAPPNASRRSKSGWKALGALRVAWGCVLRKRWGDTVWRLDAKRLVPTGLLRAGRDEANLPSLDGTAFAALRGSGQRAFAGCGLRRADGAGPRRRQSAAYVAR
ncbi:MAG: hypothetical protein ACLS7Z_07985 [Christensenellales bacterium]